MIKSLIFFLSLLTTLFIDYVYTSEANIYAKFPSEVEAGKEFEIEITIEKGNLSDFGRFTQTLPEGFTAKSDNHLFEFKDQRVKFLWLNLPSDNTFSVKYTIMVPATFNGDFQLTGQFAYVLDNEKKVVELIPQSILAKPSGSEINAQTAMSSNGNDRVPQQNNIECYRQFFTENGETTVKLKLKKDQLNNMAKIVEKLPVGYTATAIETNTGIFSFSDQNVKFLWMNIPSESEFVVSYKISKKDGTSIDQTQISGEFSYSANNLTYSTPILNKDFEQVTATQIPIPVKQPEIKEVAQPTAFVNYKIQIAAGHKLVNVKKYFKKYKINEKVSVIQHEGWHKYTIKNFSEYKEARDYREKIWASTPIDDAFVAAYNNGVRITVQEALMISNQKWYK